MTNGTTTIDYEYNNDGLRTQRTVTTARDHVHFFTHSVSEPTCTENGFTRHSCECGYTYVDSPVPATGHTYTASVVPDTCTTKGYTLYTCACGDSYQDGAPGHTFTTLVVEPTETVNGFTLHECACGYRYESDPVVSLGSPDADVIYDVKEYDYVYNGSSLTQLVITTTNYGDGPVKETLYFAYDGSSPMTVTYNGDVFYYVTNLQGDVVAILNDQGTAVVEYTYDAWGNILTTTGSMASTLGVANPLTYRGYVYDDESGLYYLQSRYYNPNVGRFLNADAFVSTGQGLLGNNMFAFCLNNPVVRSDTAGYISEMIIPHPMRCTDNGGGGYSGPYSKTEGLIHSQKEFEYANFPFGLSTFSFSGCGVIAIYNAMQLYGSPQSLGAIADEFLYEYGVVCCGLGGVDPFTVADYFDAHGITYSPHMFTLTLDHAVSDGDIIVFVILNNTEDLLEGIHTMTAQYVGGEYIVYNVYTNGTKGYPFQSLDDIYENSIFLVGYLIGG